ncbi:MAG: FecCD family ABC transporter permease [Candidatus Bathyarchaeia archaeon]
MTPINLNEAETAYFKRFTRWKITVTLLMLTLISTIVFAVTVGPIQISSLDVFKIIIKNIPFIGNLVKGGSSSFEEAIVLQIRLPRVLGAAIVGIALAVAGVVLQGLLRNPMADPYIIGISAGASLGASLAIAFGIGFSFFGLLYSIPLTAFVFALGTVLVVYSIARTDQEVPMLTLLLVGIAVNSLLLAIMTIIRVVSGEAIHVIMAWILGSLVACNWNYVRIVLPFTVVGVAVIYVFARDLNLILLGEEQARHLGVDTERLKKIMLASATLITAAAVSVSGIIGFIGLIIPHIARILVGPDHRILIPSSALAGAIVLILCDTIARTIISPAELPVGVFTSLLGCPFFIYLLRKRKRSVIW